MATSCCKPLKWKVGDKVKTPTGPGRVTAIGELVTDGVFMGVVYRVGRNQYWHGWQLSKKAA